ncbi:hypothetical protein [Kribbella sp. NPDC048928]|uniref:phosphotransferase-like protein n=1 Tax=Kribbella sp. NPDC048928 TaxID=3364111 RepID=UPI00371DB21A
MYPTRRPHGTGPARSRSRAAGPRRYTASSSPRSTSDDWLAIDQFHHIRARREWSEEEFLAVFQRTVLGFHRAVAGMVSAGNNVVVDHILGERLYGGPSEAFAVLRSRG